MSAILPDQRRHSRQHATTADPSSPVRPPEPVHVAMWDETPPATRDPWRCPVIIHRHDGMLTPCPEHAIPDDRPGVTLILVGGRPAGVVHPSPSGWVARVDGLPYTRATCHGTPADAITAVLLSVRARSLGYRACSRLSFTIDVSQTVTRTGVAR